MQADAAKRAYSTLLDMCPDAFKPFAELYLKDALARLDDASGERLTAQLGTISEMSSDAEKAQALIGISGEYIGSVEDQTEFGAFAEMLGIGKIDTKTAL